MAKQLITVCRTACGTNEVDVRQQAAPARTILAAPITLPVHDPEALGAIFSSDQPTPHLLMLVQMVASHIVLWHVVADSHNHEADARDSAALVELLDQVTTASNLRQACYTLAGELETYLQCKRVAVGLRSGGEGRCRLIAVSGVARFDHRSSTAHAIEAAMDEAVLRQDVTVWPAADDEQRHAALAHKKLHALEDTERVFSTPLRDDDGNPIGVMIALDDGTSKNSEETDWMLPRAPVPCKLL